MIILYVVLLIGLNKYCLLTSSLYIFDKKVQVDAQPLLDRLEMLISLFLLENLLEVILKRPNDGQTIDIIWSTQYIFYGIYIEVIARKNNVHYCNTKEIARAFKSYLY